MLICHGTDNSSIGLKFIPIVLHKSLLSAVSLFHINNFKNILINVMI